MKRVAFAVAGLALVVGIIVLRDTGDGGTTTQPLPPPPTKLKPFAAEVVVTPSPPSRPKTPENLVARPGHHRLQLAWKGDAPAYEVRWGPRTKLVTRPGTQLNGLANDQEQQIEVRAVDSFGQRSEPITTKATPRADNAPYVFVDRFDKPNEPDPALWRLGKRTDCARATSGDEDDHDRLIISTSCGTRPVSMRSRTPFVREGAESSLIIETDAPTTGGKLLLDLVPGPVSVQGDPVPPGGIRAAVSTDAAGNSIVELFPEGTATKSLPPTVPGVSVRWELALKADGTQVIRDGEIVATSPHVPQWREATALVGVAALAGDRVRAGVDLIGFRGTAPPQAPPYVTPPTVRIDGSLPTRAQAVPDVTAGQLRIAMIPAAPSTPVVTAAKVNGVELPLRPAVEGAVWRPQAEYAAIADLPKELFVNQLRVDLVTADRVQVTHTDVEFTAPKASAVLQESTEPLVDAHPVLADPIAEILDSSGQPVENGAALSRGRIVLEVRLNSLNAHVAGLAGFEVRLDGNLIATIPTTADGPAAAGRWRISLNASTLAATAHAVEVRAFSTDQEVHPETGYVPFLLRP